MTRAAAILAACLFFAALGTTASKAIENAAYAAAWGDHQ